MNKTPDFPFALDPFLATMSRLLVGQGATREIAILSNAEPNITLNEYDNWDGGSYGYQLDLQTPVWILRNLSDADIEDAEKTITNYSNRLLKAYQDKWMSKVVITPAMVSDEGWREKAKNWLAGSNVTNQGRVRSDNIASRSVEGLLFRSQAEINLFRALKMLGVSFAPLPVFVRGGADYRRIEPDFIILKDGIVLVVEVDGDTTHQETPVEAHNRITMLVHEGAHLERIRADDCNSQDSAVECAQKLLRIMTKLKNSR
ncbi:MAG: hypothetical protein KF716_11005 [Anaerolineae bacterium]|nr:hypothetical protein [Anaerolineae bacterium]